MASWPAVCPNPRKWDPRAGRHWSHRYYRRPATAGRLRVTSHESRVVSIESFLDSDAAITQSAPSEPVSVPNRFSIESVRSCSQRSRESRVSSTPNRFRFENETLKQSGGEPRRAAQQAWLHLAVSNRFTVLFWPQPQSPRPQVLLHETASAAPA